MDIDHLLRESLAELEHSVPPPQEINVIKKSLKDLTDRKGNFYLQQVNKTSTLVLPNSAFPSTYSHALSYVHLRGLDRITRV